MNNSKGLIIVISGPAGSGKSTVTKYIRENPEYVFSISRTTRYTRPGEVDGVDYYFISKEEFQKKLDENDFLEHAEYCGEFYGTPKSLVYEQIEKGKNVILEIEVDGAMQVKERCPDAILIMLLPPSFGVQEARLRGRGTEPEEKIQKRLEKTKRELPFAHKYYYIVYNYDGMSKEAADDIFAIVRSEKLTSARRNNVEKEYFEN
jgi:guanylate kinase